jgi:phage protein D
MVSTTEPALSATSPVFTVGGQTARELGRDCLRLEVEEDTRGLRTMEVHLAATGVGAPGPPGRMLHLESQELDFGSRIQVSVGPPDGQRIVFDGVVSAIEAVFADGAPPAVVIRAEDALMRLRMVRRAHTFTNVTDGGIADAVAGFHGLDSSVAIGPDVPTYPVVQQFNQSDLAFLRERARLVEAEIWCDGQTLHMATRPNRAGTELTLVQGGSLLAARLCADLAHQRTTVTVTGYDASARGVIEQEAGGDVIRAEATGGRTGPQVVDLALGTSAAFRVREVPLDQTQARAWARAEMLRRGRRFVTVSGLTRGSPDMVVGSRLTLVDVGQPFDGGGYYATRVRHTFDHTSALRTHFEAERPTVNEGT